MDKKRVRQGILGVWLSLMNAIPVQAAVDHSREDYKLLMGILGIFQSGGVLFLIVGFLLFLITCTDSFVAYRRTAAKMMGFGAVLYFALSFITKTGLF